MPHPERNCRFRLNMTRSLRHHRTPAFGGSPNRGARGRRPKPFSIAVAPGVASIAIRSLRGLSDFRVSNGLSAFGRSVAVPAAAARVRLRLSPPRPARARRNDGAGRRCVFPLIGIRTTNDCQKANPAVVFSSMPMELATPLGPDPGLLPATRPDVGKRFFPELRRKSLETLETRMDGGRFWGAERMSNAC